MYFSLSWIHKKPDAQLRRFRWHVAGMRYTPWISLDIICEFADTLLALPGGPRLPVVVLKKHFSCLTDFFLHISPEIGSLTLFVYTYFVFFFPILRPGSLSSR